MSTYLVYEGPGGLRVEMGETSVVPGAGEAVRVDGKRYTVVAIEWDVFTLEGSTDDTPASCLPQQCATVTLARRQR